MENNYSIPKVTIDLDEYNELLQLKEKDENLIASKTITLISDRFILEAIEIYFSTWYQRGNAMSRNEIAKAVFIKTGVQFNWSDTELALTLIEKIAK